MARGVFTAATAITAAGHNAVTSPPRCYVYNSANISVANATSQALTFDRVPNSGGADGSRNNINGIYSIAAGSYFELYAYQNSGGALNATASGAVGISFWATWLSINP